MMYEYTGDFQLKDTVIMCSLHVSILLEYIYVNNKYYNLKIMI